jgi:hypothetical protein
MENKAVVELFGRETHAINNSAHQGGFAYMKDLGTKMTIKPSIIRKHPY